MIDKKTSNDILVLKKFIQAYCNMKHKDIQKQSRMIKGPLSFYLKAAPGLCNECIKTLLFAASKRLTCPFIPKPQCKHCTDYCYKEPYRSNIKKIMKFSGIYFIKHGRLDPLWKYLF